MNLEPSLSKRLRGAWAGRVSGCLLGKPLEVLSFRQGRNGILNYLEAAGALPLRDYVPALEGSLVDRLARSCSRGRIERAEPDDDINYTVLALMLVEHHGRHLDSADVARAWLRWLPAGVTWTAERAAYCTLLNRMSDEFVNGQPPGFDLGDCAENRFNDWIGGQIRADLYGWVCPGDPTLAATLAGRDASLSHRGDGVHAAMFIAALGAGLGAGAELDEAIDRALDQVPGDGGVARAVRLGRSLADAADAVDRLHVEFDGYSPVHALNNLALVVWALCRCGGDFDVAVGEVVSAGWDTDCNGATVGGLCGIAGMTIPDHWTRPWQGRVSVDLAGIAELTLDELVARTVTVTERMGEGRHAIH